MATYLHTNLVAADWRRLARFYEDVFGCTPVLPERYYEGDWLGKGVGLPGARTWARLCRWMFLGEAL